jgi:hypothetical protein
MNIEPDWNWRAELGIDENEVFSSPQMEALFKQQAMIKRNFRLLLTNYRSQHADPLLPEAAAVSRHSSFRCSMCYEDNLRPSQVYYFQHSDNTPFNEHSILCEECNATLPRSARWRKICAMCGKPGAFQKFKIQSSSRSRSRSHSQSRSRSRSPSRYYTPPTY